MEGRKCSYSCEFSGELDVQTKLLDSLFGSDNLTYCSKQKKHGRQEMTAHMIWKGISRIPLGKNNMKDRRTFACQPVTTTHYMQYSSDDLRGIVDGMWGKKEKK